MDESVTFELFIVTPEPPITIYQGTAATVTITQHPVPQRVACLISAVVAMHPVTRIWETARSTGPLERQGHLLELSGVHDHCVQREAQGAGRCHLRLGHREIPHDEAIPIHDGLGIQIHIPAPMRQQDAADQIIDLFQSNLNTLHRQCHSDCCVKQS